ncbi:MAG TPA: IS110 family transposase [Ktedonobacteraceae bacterium]|nr:IS110 family transposase [Ktedonobacteraceae bacterium]
MQVIDPRCCGLDVHKKFVVACVMLTLSNGQMQKQIRTFSTMTADLLAPTDWLQAMEVTVVAMESTGVFWHPVYSILEEGREIILVSAQHMKAVPGRKTDVKESKWLAELLRHGLLKASFIPPKPIRDLRELVRYRKALMKERTQEANRLQKVLEGANLKLVAVATDVLGKSGRSMLEALVEGKRDPDVLAELARGAFTRQTTRVAQGARRSSSASSKPVDYQYPGPYRFLGGISGRSASGGGKTSLPFRGGGGVGESLVPG